jgi:hypothetical protein
VVDDAGSTSKRRRRIAKKLKPPTYVLFLKRGDETRQPKDERCQLQVGAMSEGVE